jgi:hypothetical protein
MIKNVFQFIAESVRGLWRNRYALAVFAGLYALLLAVLYLFVATREATTWQVIVTLVLAALAPLLFFVLQAMLVQYSEGERSIAALFKRALPESVKLALVTLPPLLLAWLFVYLLNKIQAHYPLQPFVLNTSAAGISTPQMQWSQVIFATTRVLLFGFALPLLTIHLWLAAARDGLAQTFKKIGNVLARAYTLPSVLIYAVGMIFFALVPYLLLFMHTRAEKSWLEFGLFNARLVVVFICTFFGWVITLGALARKEVSGDAAPGDAVPKDAIQGDAETRGHGDTEMA